MLVRTKNLSGALTKSPRVHTNTPGEPPNGIILKITGEVWQAVQVTPRSANFGRVALTQADDAGLVRKVTVVSNVETPLNLTNLRSTNPAFRLESTVLEPGKKAEISVTLLKPLRTGSNYARIDADTGIPEQPTVQFTATAYLTPEVEAAPKQILLTSNRPRTTTRFITIRNEGKEQLKILEVSVSNPRIIAQVQDTSSLAVPRRAASTNGQDAKAKAGRSFKITLAIPADLKFSPTGEQVTVRTDNPRFPVLTVAIKERLPRATAARTRLAPSRPGTRSVGTPFGSRPPAGTDSVAPNTAAKPAAKRPTAKSVFDRQTPPKRPASGG